MQASAETEDAAVEWLVRDVRRQSWEATDHGRLLLFVNGGWYAYTVSATTDVTSGCGGIGNDDDVGDRNRRKPAGTARQRRQQ